MGKIDTGALKRQLLAILMDLLAQLALTPEETRAVMNGLNSRTTLKLSEKEGVTGGAGGQLKELGSLFAQLKTAEEEEEREERVAQEEKARKARAQAQASEGAPAHKPAK